MNPMHIEITGDVWLLSDIVFIGLDENTISIRLRGWNDEQFDSYDMDSEEEAIEKHAELVAAWIKWCSGGS